MKAGSIGERFGRVPPLVKVGMGCGLLAGASIGLMVSAPAGIIVGLSLGASAGLVAGLVMDQEDKRTSLQTRRLDDIIGVTSGSLGAPSSVKRPPVPPPLSRQRELKEWVIEWMTPPAPQVERR